MYLDSKKLNINLIKEMLYLEVEKYNKAIINKKELESDLSIYNVLVDLLEKEDFEELNNNYILFDTYIPIFFGVDGKSTENILNKFYSAIHLCRNRNKNPEKYFEKDYKKALEVIRKLKVYLKTLQTKKEAELLSSNPAISLETLIEYKRMISNFKFGKLITNEEYDLLKDLFSRYKLTTKDQIILLESIKNSNIKVHFSDSNKKLNNEKTHEIINILNSGFEKLVLPTVSDERKKEIDSFIETCYSVMNDYGDDFCSLLPECDDKCNFTNGYSKTQFDYLIKSLMIKIQNEMQTDASELSNMDNYNDRELRKIIVVDYKECLKNYLMLRDYYDGQVEKYNISIDKTIVLPDVLDVHYVTHEGNNKTYFESDLKDISKDLYNEIKDLLVRFKKDLLVNGEIKALNEVFSGYLEIKDDQIRITYKHLSGNSYIITGVFIKKENTGRAQYKKVCTRNISFSLPAKEADEEIFKLLEENKHKGGRLMS